MVKDGNHTLTYNITKLLLSTYKPQYNTVATQKVITDAQNNALLKHWYDHNADVKI